MKVKVAENSGFCFGVEAAIKKVSERLRQHISDTKLYSLGPIVHNPQVMADFLSQGLKIIDCIEEADNNSCVIIRSHGAPKSVYQYAEDNGIEIIDTTCPFVKRVREIAESHYSRGYKIAIVGDPEHPEVVGINGWCNYEAYVIKDISDIEKLPVIDRLCVVSQTTASLAKYSQIISHLKSRTGELKEFNTICSATKKRQTSTRALAKEAEAMIVIGGKSSSNTKKLAEICREEKPSDTFHIETSSELRVEILENYKVVGITAGASTPHISINDVIAKINEHKRTKK